MASKEFEEGQQAFIDGDSEDDCPYKIGTAQRKYWMQGYFQTAQEEGAV